MITRRSLLANIVHALLLRSSSLLHDGNAGARPPFHLKCRFTAPQSDAGARPPPHVKGRFATPQGDLRQPQIKLF